MTVKATVGSGGVQGPHVRVRGSLLRKTRIAASKSALYIEVLPHDWRLQVSRIAGKAGKRRPNLFSFSSSPRSSCASRTSHQHKGRYQFIRHVGGDSAPLYAASSARCRPFSPFGAGESSNNHHRKHLHLYALDGLLYGELWPCMEETEVTERWETLTNVERW